MKFKILCTDGYGEPWWEEYNKDTENPQQYAENLIAHFNATLRGPEKPRILLKVEILDSSNDELHRWVKSVLGMSAIFRGHVVDLMYCERCGITGKRYGLGGEIILDSKFRKKAFRRCDTAQAELKAGIQRKRVPVGTTWDIPAESPD